MFTSLQLWSIQVKQRDQKCMHCGALEDLRAHHIKHKSTHPGLKLDVSNGICLCYRCHKAQHERTRSECTVRIRSNNPQRRTLIRKIDELNKRIVDLENQIAAFKNTLKPNSIELDTSHRNNYMT